METGSKISSEDNGEVSTRIEKALTNWDRLNEQIELLEKIESFVKQQKEALILERDKSSK